MLLGIMLLIPFNVLAEESDTKDALKEEKVSLVICDDGESSKFRNDNNDLLNIKFIGISIPDEMQMQAKTYVCDTLNDASEIKLEYDPLMTKDSYGRIVSWITVDGTLLQQLLVSNGYANLTPLNLGKYEDILNDSLEAAQKNYIGMWEKKTEIIKEEVKENVKETKKNFFERTIGGLFAAIINFFNQIIENILKIIQKML